MMYGFRELPHIQGTEDLPFFGKEGDVIYVISESTSYVFKGDPRNHWAPRVGAAVKIRAYKKIIKEALQYLELL